MYEFGYENLNMNLKIYYFQIIYILDDICLPSYF